MVWKTRKRSKKRSETWPKKVEPLSGRLKIFHRHFSKSFSPPQICRNKYFSPRESPGVAMLTYYARNPPEWSSRKISCKKRAKNAAKNLANYFAALPPSISMENGRKKVQKKPSTFATAHQITFFHRCNSGRWAAQHHTMRPQIVTHTFWLFGNQFLNYTGHLLHRAFWQEFFCVIRGLHRVLSVNVPIAHMNYLGIIFRLQAPLLHKKYFPVYLCNHFGPHSTVVSKLITDRHVSGGN